MDITCFADQILRNKFWLELHKNDETTIQEVNPISNLDPISNEPGDVTIVSEKSGITYAILNSVGPTVDAEIIEDGDKLTIAFTDTVIPEEEDDYYTPLYYEINVDKDYEHEYLIVLLNGEDAILNSLIIQ